MIKNDNLDNIELRSEDLQEVLKKVPHWMIRWGNVLFLSLILLVLIISWFVKYPDIILSEVIVTTQIPPQKEYAKLTGKITAILVKDNQIVKKNQLLAVLESTANYKDMYTLKNVINRVVPDINSFYFPIDSLSMLNLGDVETEFSLFQNFYIQYKLNNELKPFSSEDLANKNSILELKIQLQSLESQKKINKIQVDFIAKDFIRNKTLFDKGIISAQIYENKEVEYAQAKRDYINFQFSISQINQRLSDAYKTYKNTKISKIKEDDFSLKKVTQSFNQLKKAIKDWEYKYVFKSNINGNVSYLNYWSTNQTINEGDVMFIIISSENSAYIAKLKTPSLNSGKITIGQNVNIKLDNYPDMEYGVLNGKVKSVSAIPDKNGFYFVDVQLPNKLITSYNKKIEFKQEMRGSAEIVTEDSRLIERFFHQFIKLLKR
jgi:multidrug resistance efflux pump